MEKYSIYCTDEETRKAIELGAPIYVFDKWNSEAIERTHFKIEHRAKLDNGLYAENPTAEQLIGWLEEQKIFVHIKTCFDISCSSYFSTKGYNRYGYVSKIESFRSREEATLTVIDKALDYLIKNKNSNEHL